MTTYNKGLCEDAIATMKRDPMALTGEHMQQLEIAGMRGPAIAAREVSRGVAAAPRVPVTTAATLEPERLGASIMKRVVSLLTNTLVPVVKEALAVRDDRIAALETRLAELEKRPTLKWAGVFEPSRAYAEGSLVTRSGSLWLSTALTAQQPGSSPDWRLIVKRGAYDE